MDLLIVLNNYFHDLATGTLFASGIVSWALASKAMRGGAAQREALVAVYPWISKVLLVSLAWILLGGVPRTLSFERYEFVPAGVKGLYWALGLKHVLMFAAAACGLFAWSRARAMYKNVAAEGQPDRKHQTPVASAGA